jgi:hypothetical protein
VADSLVDSLVAQSLDLPPGAARWRHQQRAMQVRAPQPRRVLPPALPARAVLAEGCSGGMPLRSAGTPAALNSGRTLAC